MTTIEINPTWNKENGINLLMVGNFCISSYVALGKDGKYSAVKHWDSENPTVTIWNAEGKAIEECERHLELFIQSLRDGR